MICTSVNGMLGLAMRAYGAAGVRLHSARLAHQVTPRYEVSGLIGAPVTPFNENEDLALDKVPSYIDHFLEFGVKHAFVCGTTGESINLTVDERKQVAEAWMKEGRAKLSSIILHIGAGNVKDSMELARHAEGLGVDAISCISPTFFKPATTDAYVEYMRRVAAAAPNTPFLLYDNINFTGLTLDVNEFFHKGCNVMPTLAGTKHTSQNFPSMHLCHMDHHDAGMQIIMGTNDFMLEGLTIGLSATIMNSYMGKILNRVIEAFEKGDLETARKEQGRAVLVVKVQRKMGFGVPDGAKTVLKMLGMDMGPCRCPVSRVTPEKEAALKKDLTEIGFFDWGVN